MTKDRQHHIAIQLENNRFVNKVGIRQALFNLYDDKQITGPELDHLMDKLDGLK